MIRSLKVLIVALFLLIPLSAFALTVDNSTWGGHVNSGWYGSGQSLTVDSTENVLDSIGFYFDSESFGKSFTFVLSDALNSGATLFTTSFVVGSDLNVININRELTPASIVYALIDYNGFNGKTAHFNYTDTYAGGNSSFGAIGSQEAYTTLDHRFIAEFSASSPVPEPATLLLLGSGLAGLAFYRRKRK